MDQVCYLLNLFVFLDISQGFPIKTKTACVCYVMFFLSESGWQCLFNVQHCELKRNLIISLPSLKHFIKYSMIAGLQMLQLRCWVVGFVCVPLGPFLAYVSGYKHLTPEKRHESNHIDIN